MVWKGGKPHRALGMALGLWALALIINNLFGFANGGPWPSAYSRLWSAGLYVAYTIAVGFTIARWARQDKSAMLLPLSFSAAAFVLMLATGALAANLHTPTTIALQATGVPSWGVQASSFANAAAVSSVALVALYSSVRLARAPAREKGRRLVPMAVAIGLFFVYQLSSVAVYPLANPLADVLGVVLAAFVILAMAGALLVAASRGAGRSCVVGAMALLAAAMLGLAIPSLAHIPSDQLATDPTGMKGVLRTIGWLVFVYAILRHDILGLGLRSRTVNRGAIAAAALASLFIVAQVAQNFLSSEYGLLTGGVIAGAFLFTAHPLQQAVEKLRSPTRPAPASSAGPAQTDAKRLATYRDAARYALRDGRVTRNEEAHLADLAQQLGIWAGDAMRVRHEVQDAVGRG